MRFFLILTTILVMTYSKKGLHFAEPGYIIALIYLVSNLIFYRLPENLFKKPIVSFLIFLFDLVIITLSIYLTEGVETDFYLIYFLAIFISSVGQTVGGSLPIAVVASIFYAWLLHRAQPDISLLDSKFLIRIPFLFIISLISSYWSESTRKELKEKEELEKFNRELKKEVERIAAKEIELRQYNEKIIASVGSGILATRSDGIITTLNPEAERAFGFGSEEMSGYSIKDLPGLRTLWDKMEKSMSENKPIMRDEVLIRNKNNVEIPIGFNVSPMAGPDRVTGCVVIFKDLSEIRRLQEQLKHAERLSYLGKMSSWIAHEIRNPLTSIAGFAQLLMEAKNKKKIDLFSSEINKAALRINHIIDDVLTFARAKKIETTDIQLMPILTSIVTGLKINVIITGDKKPVVIGETESIRRLFINIVNNSIEAMDENGKLEINFSHNKNYCLVKIVDNGKGISQENLKKLFEPFFTTKPRGTGLGLAIIKKIVEEHNGKIEIKSEENKGTTCLVSLPRK